MRDPDEVRLVIAGREITGWTGVTLDMGIDHMVDGLSVTASWNPESSLLRGIVSPFGYERVDMYIGEERLLTGRIDKVTPGISAGDRIITLEARSLTGALADCSIDGDLEHSKLAIFDIAGRICKPFGISVADYALDARPIDEARAEYGQMAGDFLNELAAPRNLILASGSDGRLCIYCGRDFATLPPIARLVEGSAPVLSVSASYDSTGRFSLYRAASQFAGAENVKGDATDTAISVYRPRLVVAGDMDTDPSKTAARIRAEAIAASIQVSVELTGWRSPDGLCWRPRDIVTLKAPSAMLYTEAPWLVANTTPTLDESNGRTTMLRLIPPMTFSGELPARYPWE